MDIAAQPIRAFDDLPGPRVFPLVGNLLQIEPSKMHLQLEAWCRQFGPVFRLRLGKRRAVVVGDHELISAALRDRPDGFRRTVKFEQIWTELGLAGGVFGANGDDWKRQRKLVMAAFDPSHVKRYFPSLKEVGNRLVARWEAAASEHATIDLQADLMRFTVDVVSGLAFGSPVNTLGSDEDSIQKHLNRVFPAVFTRMFAPLATWRWIKTERDRELERSVLEINRAVASFVEHARSRLASDPARRANPPNLLESMLVAAALPDSRIESKHVAGNVLVMLLAGEDTTANTLAWIVYLLWTHPETLARAKIEVRTQCPDFSAATIEQINDLKYVEACAHEAMRLRPVAPLQTMQALRDTVLGDVRIEEGMLLMSVMRRDSVSDAHVPNAAAFDPDRWLIDDASPHAANSAKRISMPFGAGPRICPGRYLALMEIKVAIAALLSEFDIEDVDTPDGIEPQEILFIAMAPSTITMKLRRRGPSKPRDAAHQDISRSIA